MRAPRAIAWIAAAFCLLTASFSTLDVVDASAVKAGAPEHLSAGLGMCPRTFHSKGAVGCRSFSDADKAPLFPIATAAELTAFVNGDAPHQDADTSYVLVMPESLLSLDAVAKAFDRIRGVFAYPQFRIANASFASPTPQGANTIDGALNPFASSNVTWHVGGNSLLEQELPFPVVLLPTEAAGDAITTRAAANLDSSNGATYTAFLNYYFGPDTMDSLQCLAFRNIYGQRSPKCDPIGGQSVWSVRGSASDSNNKKPIVLATASLDATALSHVLAPGANTAASGVVALLAAAKALQVIPDAALAKRIVFTLFQAEKFGFVGSRKFLSDVQLFTQSPTSCQKVVEDKQSPFGSRFCLQPMLSSLAFTNIQLPDVAYAIAVDQVGVLPPSGNFTVHFNPFAGANTSNWLDAITNAPSAGSKIALGTTNALPPTPLTTFVNAGEFGNQTLNAAVLAGFDGQSDGRVASTFNSRHDTLDTIDPQAVTRAAQVLAEALYALAAVNVSTDAMQRITVDEAHVSELLTCLTTDWRCKLMHNMSQIAVDTTIAYLDLRKDATPSSAMPTTLYAGPLDAKRQMLIRKLKANDDGTAQRFVQFNETWDADVDRVDLFPNAYEVFVRAYLAAAMAPSATATTGECTKSQSCNDGMECVYPGVCAPQRAFFHQAISPGLKRTAALGVYDVVNATMPLWTEPQWDQTVGSYVFPDPGEWIGWLALAIGVVVSAAGVGIAKIVLARVHKLKLL